jgi:hypothetical protein
MMLGEAILGFEKKNKPHVNFLNPCLPQVAWRNEHLAAFVF